MTRAKATRFYLVAVVLGLLTGGLLFFTAWLQQLTSIRLPDWFKDALFGVGLLAILVYGIYLVRRQPILSKRWIIVATVVALLFNGAGLAYAAYTGPNRSTSTTVWDRQQCQYHATSSGSGCDLTLYHTTGGCDSTGSVAIYFNNAPTACGTGWPGTCGVNISCSISQTSSSTVGCSSGDSNCTSHTSTINLSPATVSGNPACANPGNSGWCKGGDTIDLTGTEPVSGWAITAIESDLFGSLCTGNASTLSCTWTFADGNYTMNYWADSSHLDTSTSSSISVKLDSVAPSVSLALTSGTTGSAGWYTSPVQFTGTASDPAPSSGIASTKYVLDGGAPQTGSSVTISSDGTHTVYFTTQDTAGNDSVPSATASVRIDRTPPVVGSPVLTGTLGLAGWYTTPVGVSVTASDATSGVASTQYSVDGGVLQDGPLTLTDDVHTVSVVVTDNAGNTTTVSTSAKVDTTPPVSAFIYPAEGSTVQVSGNQTVHMTGSTSDPTSGVAGAEISSDNGTTWQTLPLGAGNTWSYDWSVLHGNGTYTFLVRASDNAGNIEHTAHVTFVVDNTGPSASITPLWVDLANATVSFSQGSLPIAGARITVSDPKGRWPDAVTEYNSSNLPTQFTWLGRMGDGSIGAVGKYKVTVRVWDSFGNTGSAEGWVVIPLPPPQPTKTTVAPAAPQPTVAAVLPAATSAPAPVIVPTQTAVAPVVIPAPTRTQVVVLHIDPIYLWPALALGAFLAVLGASTLSDKKYKAYRNLQSTLDRIMQQKVATRDLDDD